MDGLSEGRARLTRIDARLLRLLNLRAGIIAELHARKTAAGRPIYDGARTDEILDRLARLNRGPLRDEQVRALFATMLQHFAFEHRPGATTGRLPLLIAAVPPSAPLERAALRLRRNGVRFLRLGRLPEPERREARRVCDESGLRLVLAASTAADVRSAAPLADMIESSGSPNPELTSALAACGRPVLLAGGAAEAVADLRRAGAGEVLVTRTVGGGRDGIAPVEGAAAVLADAREAEPRRAAVLGALAAGAQGALFTLFENEDDEALAEFVHRATRLHMALSANPGQAEAADE